MAKQQEAEIKAVIFEWEALIEIQVDELPVRAPFLVLFTRLCQQVFADIAAGDIGFPLEIIQVRKALFSCAATDIQNLVIRLKFLVRASNGRCTGRRICCGCQCALRGRWSFSW